jgi:hypothetical protein
MPPKFTELAFTPTVKAIQTQNGSRQAYARMEVRGPNNDTLTPTSGGIHWRSRWLLHGHRECQWLALYSVSRRASGLSQGARRENPGVCRFWWQRPVPQCGQSGRQRSRVPLFDGLRPPSPSQNLGSRHCGRRSPRLNRTASCSWLFRRAPTGYFDSCRSLGLELPSAHPPQIFRARSSQCCRPATSPHC